MSAPQDLSQRKQSLLVTGATGFIGSRFARLALDREHEVRTLTRSDWSDEPSVLVSHRFLGRLPNQIPAVALEGVQGVVHLAAETAPGDRASHAVNVAGTLNLAQMAIAAGVRTFIFVSSQSAQPGALSAYGRSKYAAEQALCALENINVVILRPGLVCGPGGRGLFKRMCSSVESLPVLPLLAGGKSIVQPIHVDDLCDAIFQCVALSEELAGSVLHVGDETGVSLAVFLKALARARLGKSKPALHIPLWPIEIAVRMAEFLRLPLPISSENLKGMKVVKRMETGPDMARLGLQLRSIEATLKSQDTGEDPPRSAGLDRRAVRTVVIGTGRIGLVHTVTLSRLPGFDLRGLIDTKKAALNLIRGMGFSIPGYASLDQALSNGKVDAAVIATPPASHLQLARLCLSKGLGVLIERPLAVSREQLADYRQLAQEFPDLAMQAGYVLPRNPQVSSYIKRLREGEFGKVQGFMGFSLFSLIQQAEPGRWEVTKEVSGGGVLINAGAHVLSMIRSAFDDPIRIEAQSLKLYLEEIEDSVVTRFQYPGFSGVHCCSWSMKGFPRQENRLVILTENGQLILTGSVGVFVGRDGTVDLQHQLDFDVGFNLAPDYAGAGFSTELSDLKQTVQTGRAAPMNITVATQLEELLFGIYADVQTVDRFQIGKELLESPGEPLAHKTLNLRTKTEPVGQPLKRVLDLRELSDAAIRGHFSGGDEKGEWDEYLLTPLQLPNLSRD